MSPNTLFFHQSKKWIHILGSWNQLDLAILKSNMIRQKTFRISSCTSNTRRTRQKCRHEPKTNASRALVVEGSTSSCKFFFTSCDPRVNLRGSMIADRDVFLIPTMVNSLWIHDPFFLAKILRGVLLILLVLKIRITDWHDGRPKPTKTVPSCLKRWKIFLGRTGHGPHDWKHKDLWLPQLNHETFPAKNLENLSKFYITIHFFTSPNITLAMAKNSWFKKKKEKTPQSWD